MISQEVLITIYCKYENKDVELEYCKSFCKGYGCRNLSKDKKRCDV
jgi:hypothetical protein